MITHGSMDSAGVLGKACLSTSGLVRAVMADVICTSVAGVCLNSWQAPTAIRPRRIWNGNCPFWLVWPVSSGCKKCS